ncbi:MAG: OmpA family protein [Candidatus Omnitrophica bacterium]|nr:OmpA family protein [Candidatus Omnitrophota bacterium]MDD5236632.1 OmpA family protein [Candidatus Omnitrophota bacterium]MDD5611132.1 OmpA family protein [Candidatus Omnitrophota bacterium]
MRKTAVRSLFMLMAILFCVNSWAWDIRTSQEERKAKREESIQALQSNFSWWPTDAKPGPVKDERGGYWWWPKEPGASTPWGNRGYIYLYKIIYDYQSEELPAAKPNELRPSLLIKKIIKNVKIYFDYDKSSLRQDGVSILESAVKTLGRNPTSNILITGNCDVRGPESYNIKLGRKRAEAVKAFMINNGIPSSRIKIVSRGKLDAVAPLADLVGMQKDRNAQFVIAEVEEVMLPAPGEAEAEGAVKTDEGKYVVEEKQAVESEVKVETKEYVVKKGDTLWKIAERECGAGHRWKNIYEMNKAKIRNPNKLKAGIKIVIPVE